MGRLQTSFSGLKNIFNIKLNSVVVSMLALLFLIIVRRAWVSDDAFITMRTVDNFVNNYGLTWNVAERVQAYTHPLWMFLLIPIYFLLREPFYTFLILGIGLTILAAYHLLRRHQHELWIVVILTAALSLSRAFVDYSTSGLENPLSHLMIALFAFNYLDSWKKPDRKSILRLSLFASLGMLNRIDLGLLFVPALGTLLLRYRKWDGPLQALLGFLPLILWEVFSVIYYGFPFPNTAYAKLGHSFNSFVVIKQGLVYLIHSLSHDPLTILIICLPIALWFGSANRMKLLPLVLGVLLSLAYVIAIGGDFMSGRFLTPAFFLSLLLLAEMLPVFEESVRLILLAIFLILGFSIPYHTLTLNISEPKLTTASIDDERIYFFDGAALATRVQNAMTVNFKWAVQGTEYQQTGYHVTHARAIGFFGYYVGQKVYVIDGHGLADPLLARLPVQGSFGFTAGHVLKPLPKGYRDSLNSGQNEITDVRIAAYYDKLNLITRGALFDPARWQAIWEMNTGQLNYLLHADYEQ